MSPEYADVGDEDLATILAGASELMIELLGDLAARPGERRRYGDVEDSLSWSRGRLASVFGGYAVFANGRVGGKRPFRIGKSEGGEYWIWMDAERAAAVDHWLSRVSR
jgi:hypothetical protein